MEQSILICQMKQFNRNAGRSKMRPATHPFRQTEIFLNRARGIDAKFKMIALQKFDSACFSKATPALFFQKVIGGWQLERGYRPAMGRGDRGLVLETEKAAANAADGRQWLIDFYHCEFALVVVWIHRLGLLLCCGKRRWYQTMQETELGSWVPQVKIGKAGKKFVRSKKRRVALDQSQNTSWFLFCYR